MDSMSFDMLMNQILLTLDPHKDCHGLCCHHGRNRLWARSGTSRSSVLSPKNITHHHHDITSNAIIRLPIPPSNAVIFLQVMQGQGLHLGDNYSL